MKRIFVSLMIAIAVFFGVLVTVNYAAPGDETDPVVTKSYLDNVFTEKINATYFLLYATLFITDITVIKMHNVNRMEISLHF